MTDSENATENPTENDTENDTQAKLVELMNDLYIGMFTTIAGDGILHSVPMARQEVEASDELWFITARDTDKVRDLETRPQVNVTFSSSSSWVSVHGTAAVVDDQAKLEELWNTFAEAWMPEGPKDPNATLIKVDLAGGEYWDTPGGKVVSLLSFAKAKLTGETYDADHGSADL